MTDPQSSRHIAADYLAALTADELAAFLAEAREPGTPNAAQLTRADLTGMTPEAIVQAKAAGRLDTLLGIAN